MPIKKKLGLIISIFFGFVALFSLLFPVIKGFNSFSTSEFNLSNLFNNSADIAVVETGATTFTVCPAGSTDTTCDYYGGDGIQQAVDAAPIGSSSEMTTINIKSGNYVRDTFSEVVRSSGHKFKYFIDTKGKNLILVGDPGAKINGAESSNMGGIDSMAGKLEVRGLTIFGFREDIGPCEVSIPCSAGLAMRIGGTTSARVSGNNLANNQVGVYLKESSQANITNNLISNNISSGINFQEGSVQLISIVNNNILTGNNLDGGYDQIDVYRNSNIEIRNNIVINGKTSGIYISNQEDSLHTGTLIIKNNLLWGNIVANYKGVVADLTGQNGNISLDPKFVDPANGNYRLQSDSPAINAGDPSILDPDGTRSDIGAYGGPGACYWDSTLLGCTPMP